VTVRYVIGDTLAVTRTIPDASVDLVITSPPFLALRSYLPDDHPDKAKELGSEPNPAAFIDMLLALTAEWRRVLAPHGTLAVELGDTYSGVNVSAAGLHAREHRHLGTDLNRYNQMQATTGRRGKDGGWPLPKSLALIPELYRVALAYGINPLTGQESPAGRWRVRNNVTWCRPNPPVGCVDDQTEALTPDGWKRHADLADGDLIAAYDKATDSCRFLPAKFVRWHREGEPMVAIEKRKTSQRLTLDHRCLVRTDKRDPFVVLADDLTNDQQVLLTAPLEEVPGPEPVTVERAELLGWYIAEGTPAGRRARIAQSLTSNPEKVARIRSLLERDGADFTESVYRITSGTYGGHQQVTFTVKGELAEWLNLHHKRLPMHYVTTWPTRTLRALWDGLIDGDGHRRRDGGTLFFQKARPVCDAVQVLALRLGLRASLTRQERMDGWQVTIGNPEHYEGSRWTKVRKWDGVGIPRETYTGVVWCPMVETSFWLARRDGRTFVTGNSLGDKFRPSTSDLVIACTSDKRWFDLDAVRYQAPDQGVKTTNGPKAKAKAVDRTIAGTHSAFDVRTNSNPAGAPPLDHWVIPPGGYKGAHYATWPAALLEKPIEACCPRRVCRTCGTPSRRLTESERVTVGTQTPGKIGALAESGAYASHGDTSVTTIGWASCDCPDTDGIRLDGYHTGTGWRPGHVLDPFGGSGTTGVVASGRSRDCTLIDLDDRNAELARERLGMFLEVETHQPEAVA
jgi:hypothetical protein